MKNASKWQASKFEFDEETKKARPLNVSSQSRFLSYLQAPIYSKTIQKYARGVLLDCGAGQLPYYSIYKDLVSEVFAVDWANSLHNISHLDKTADLNKKVPYAANKFDTVLLADVLEHLYNPFVLMKEISRVLKKEGKLICFVPFMYWVHEDPHDYHRYTRFMLEKLCNDSGLEILELKPYAGGPDVLLDVLNKLAGRSKFWSRSAYSFSVFVSKRGFYKRLKAKTQQKMPLGYSLIAQKT